MPRAQRILLTGEPRGEIVDTVLLKFADRCKQQGFVFGGKGTCIEFDFPSAPRLRTDDVLLLDDGTLAEVVADAEPLLEVREKDFAKAARLVWLLGNRHVPVHILANRIRVLGTPELEALLAEQGITSMKMSAPFEPDDDAQGHHHHDHHHDHDHNHDHGHHHDHQHHGHDHHDRDHPHDHHK